ncbi:hypothetical protein SUGI_0804580 [Cryptomeria japonica]|nr:hypothetical protein SUGI_0804580 [Cryptomeria japonica]
MRVQCRHGTQEPVGVHRTDVEKKRWEAHMFDLRQPSCIPFTLWIVFLDLYFARLSASHVVQQFTDLITHTAATPYWASGIRFFLVSGQQIL